MKRHQVPRIDYFQLIELPILREPDWKVWAKVATTTPMPHLDGGEGALHNALWISVPPALGLRIIQRVDRHRGLGLTVRIHWRCWIQLALRCGLLRSGARHLAHGSSDGQRSTPYNVRRAHVALIATLKTCANTLRRRRQRIGKIQGSASRRLWRRHPWRLLLLLWSRRCLSKARTWLCRWRSHWHNCGRRSTW